MPTSRAADTSKTGTAGLRGQWLKALSAQATNPESPQTSLAARFGSFADTIQTRLDSSNGVGPTLTGSLQAQVDRALSQVLRQAPTNGSPTGYGATGGPETAPLVAQSVAMLTGTGGPPAIAPQQAALVQEATLVKGDLLAVLDMLQPLSTFGAAPSDLAAVTAIVRAEVEMLVEEFARTTLRPRTQRVRVLLGGLLGWQADLTEPPYPGDLRLLLNLLNVVQPVVPTLLVEQQRASQDVLVNDAKQLLGAWRGAGNPSPWEANLGVRKIVSGGRGGAASSIGMVRTAVGAGGSQVPSRLAMIRPTGASAPGSYSERLIQADLLLPVVGQDAARVAGALDAIGLSQGEQEATYLDLPSLVDMDLLLDKTLNPPALPKNPPPKPPLPVLPDGSVSVLTVTTSVRDILDWAAGLADGKTLDLLRTAGQLGLDLIADQADELFWLVVAMFDPGAQAQLLELADVQVQQELLTLARDLNMLAGLAAPTPAV